MLCWQEPEWFLYIRWISLQRICIRLISKGYYSRLGVSEEHLRICLGILNYGIIGKKERTPFMEEFTKVLTRYMPGWDGISLKLN